MRKSFLIAVNRPKLFKFEAFFFGQSELLGDKVKPECFRLDLRELNAACCVHTFGLAHCNEGLQSCETVLRYFRFMSFAHEPIFQWLAQYAFQPELVYLGVFAMMMASGFGFPLPEEVTIVSVGIITYMGTHPEHFPPPYVGAPVVDGYEAAAVTLGSVIFADLIIFSIGRFFGRKLMTKTWFQRLFPESAMHRVNEFMKKYGVYAAFIFRFTPGLRFPAHVAMGMTNFPIWQFGLVDGLAAAISVPTQILLIYHYGEPILGAMQKFKYFIFGALAIALLIFFVRRLIRRARPAL